MHLDSFHRLLHVFRVQPTLDFAAAAAKRGESFFATLLTTATHHPYNRLYDIPASWKAQGSPKLRFLQRIRDADTMAYHLVAGLKSLGLWQNTLFVVVADHGEGFGEQVKHIADFEWSSREALETAIHRNAHRSTINTADA